MPVSDTFICVACFFLMFVFVPIRIKHENTVEKRFVEYMKDYNKTYGTVEIYGQRLKAFEKSLNMIETLNAARTHSSSALYGLTYYSDLTTDEFLDKQLQLSMFERIQSRYFEDSDEDDSDERKRLKRSMQVPLKVDWRKKGVITEVNNQQFCGACWAFSTVENIEAMYAIKTGNLYELSVQEMIDCAEYNDGCNGGDMCNLLMWLKNEHIKIQKGNEYPLQLRNERCKLNNTREGIQISNFACENLVGDEDFMLATIATQGPVAVAINALTWQNYLSGVIQYHCDGSSSFLNHAVQIVGYDLSAEVPHYIVRNSWGKDFGDAGYLYIGIGGNICGIANEVIALNVS